jgi:hypothetical protein
VRYGLGIIKVMFTARCQTQLKLTGVCREFNAQMYISDIIFGISVLFITLHNDRLFVSLITCSLATITLIRLPKVPVAVCAVLFERQSTVIRS